MAVATGYQTISACRACYSSKLNGVLNLGNQYISDFITPGQDRYLVPIEIAHCEDCGLVQAINTPPLSKLYQEHYWYRSGVTQTMRRELADVARSAAEYFGKRVPYYISGKRKIILDIGANDGTYLSNWSGPPHNFRVAVEPAQNLFSECEKHCERMIPNFWSAEDYFQAVSQKASIITACGMFYDLDDPNQFIADIAKVLDPQGLFVAQLMCLKQTLEKSDVGNFAHEHLEFYTVRSLSHLLEKHGLKIEHIEENGVNGGSYRFYIRHARVANPLNSAAAYLKGFDDAISNTVGACFEAFTDRIEQTRSDLLAFIHNAERLKRSIWVYGASTKGNTLLQYWGLDSTAIGGAADRSPEKYGKYMVGGKIPIYSLEEARMNRPHCFLVLPYAFIDEFVELEKNQPWRKAGGIFLVPLPNLRIR